MRINAWEPKAAFINPGEFRAFSIPGDPVANATARFLEQRGRHACPEHALATP